MKSLHIIVEGWVQGVFFRDYTRSQAQQYGLTGWVRNLPDGSVETLIHGKDANLSAMIDWLSMGSPLSQVTKISSREAHLTTPPSTFEIKY